jgi:hypothetical protein
MRTAYRRQKDEFKPIEVLITLERPEELEMFKRLSERSVQVGNALVPMHNVSDREQYEKDLRLAINMAECMGRQVKNVV